MASDSDPAFAATARQAADGQRVFVHPLSLKCLLHHYGGYLRLPQVPLPCVCVCVCVLPTTMAFAAGRR